MRDGKGASHRRRGLTALALASAILVAGGDAPAIPRDTPGPPGTSGDTPGPPGTSGDTPGPPGGRPWVLRFSDDFDGAALDASKWSNGFGWGPTSRNTYGYCDPSNNLVQNGTLVQRIERRRQGGKPFSAGCISSRNRFSQLHGYWEARMRVAGCPGARGAFWAKPNDESWPPELDIVEVHGDERQRARLTIHWRDAAGRHARSKRIVTGPDFSAGYHVFGARWSPTETVWYIDGVERFRTTAGAAASGERGPFYAIVNAQVYRPDSGCGKDGASSRQLVDYVRVWAEAPPGR